MRMKKLDYNQQPQKSDYIYLLSDDKKISLAENVKCLKTGNAGKAYLIFMNQRRLQLLL